jgi:hypothetical protein
MDTFSFSFASLHRQTYELLKTIIIVPTCRPTKSNGTEQRLKIEKKIRKLFTMITY